MIETQKLDFSYGSNHILQNISFTANKGEITYLAGVNGAGKTTTIRMSAVRNKNFSQKKYRFYAE